MATFVCISIKKSRVETSEQHLIRDMKNFNSEKFITTPRNELNAANLGYFVSAHDAFDKFEKALRNVVDKFAPLKNASRREKKLSLKPWLSRKQLNLIKQKIIFSNN